MVVKGKAFAPAHITGFFEIHENEDPRHKGSTGCGIVLNGGVETTVKPCKTGDRTVVTLNGSETEAMTTHTVVKMLTDIPVMVESTTDIPVGCGFGASGAGALGTAYALNQALSLDITANQLAETAHVAEVTNRSGLGDVAAQSHGGIVIRTGPGAPGYGKLDRISAGDYRLFCVVLGEISTRSVLEDMHMVEQINSAGRSALKALLQKPSLENFMALSRDFAVDPGLLSSRALDVVEAVEAAGGMASQAMLGDTVFAFPGDGMENDVHETLSGFGDVLAYNISSCCPKLVQGY
ncbi:MAG: pantoate kinase [Methanosarcinaceae archaeon]|nr:pantoate kinase [Methanosarcinaceae archaeon]